MHLNIKSKTKTFQIYYISIKDIKDLITETCTCVYKIYL